MGEEREAPPKKPTQPYIKFTIARRPAIKQERPELKAKEIMSAMGNEWSQLDEAAKKPYVDEYNAEKAEYDKKIAAYDKKYPTWREEEKAVKADLKKDKKEANGAIKKRPRGYTGCSLFQYALRKQYESRTGKKLPIKYTVQLTTQWKELSEERVAEWKAKASELNAAAGEEESG
ncbi:HMG (high mobility group) box [Carpediemonas membranifera]|uniref:HMG (High mobility group) box n=1 Tax=Carpediemonas membranifera TaxID=201153 RepID=A0A8J6E9E5_9EUKA|nr:HMG (high mobility group) box [Carpediemonas membranifera]|eukprot:KAG9393220.1 HMG (high mobility group) box [Carpediemonas membranifera]